MKHVALYCRVSQHSQTIDNQRPRLIEFAERNGYTYEIFEETESTRKTRPVKQALLERLRAKQYDGVIICKIDRWARSSMELILEIRELVDKGVNFISISDNLDFKSAAGRLQFQILCCFAEFERSLISDRTKDSLQRLKSQGVRLGRPKGAKDGKKRKRSGYILREAKKRQNTDGNNGIHKSIDTYLDK